MLCNRTCSPLIATRCKVVEYGLCVCIDNPAMVNEPGKGGLQVAKSIGYMVNANSTFGGGCPVPPPPRQDLQRFGDAFAAAVLAADNQTQLWGTSLEQAAATLDTPNVTARTLKNVTGAVVADTILGALFVAGRTCGPPNALTSSLQSSVIAKYLNGMRQLIGVLLERQRLIAPCELVGQPCLLSR